MNSHSYKREDGGDAINFNTHVVASRNAVTGVELRILGLPQNQVRESSLSVCNAACYRCDRGNPRSCLHQARRRLVERSWWRLDRGAGTYLPLVRTRDLSHPPRVRSTIDVRANRFLRPAFQCVTVKHTANGCKQTFNLIRFSRKIR